MTVAPFAMLDLVEATSAGCRCVFHVSGGDVRRKCLDCDDTFEQSDEGFRLLREHEFAHGRATLFDLSELDGRTLRMMVVQVPADREHHAQATRNPTTDLYGVDDATGTVYHLAYWFRYQDDDVDKGSWKWKITKQTPPNNGPRPTPSVQALLSNGFANTGAK